MRLAYRTANYQYNPATAETLEAEVAGQHRGADWKFHNPQQPLGPQQPLDLRYRGLAYQRQ